MATLVDQLASLATMYQQGLLSASEFQQAKHRLLAPSAPPAHAVQPPPPPPPPQRKQPKTLNPTVTGVGMSLAAGGMGLGG